MKYSQRAAMAFHDTTTKFPNDLTCITRCTNFRLLRVSLFKTIGNKNLDFIELLQKKI